MNDLCTACLCTGRRLRYIGETGLYHIYSQILSEISIYDLSEICVRICWECRAALRRLEEFKRQVKSCYSELLEHARQGHQDTKLLEKAPHLQSKQVILIDYPEIKTEYDCLDVSFDQNHLEFNHHSGQHLGQPLAQGFNQPIIQEFEQQINATELDNCVKLEDHNELKTFVNELEIKKRPERKKRGRKVDKVELPKAPREKKNKSKLKKTNKGKKKKQILIENDIKSDAESCHDYEDSYLPPLEKEDLDQEEIEEELGKKEIKKLEDLDSRECDIYQKNEVEVQFENPEEPPSQNGPVPQKKQRAAKVKQLPPPSPPSGAGGGVSAGGGRGGAGGGGGERPQCAECGKVFSSRKTLRYHLNVLHAGNNRYPCPRCGKVYQWKSNLGRHLRSHKARDTGELYCATCDKRFASVATYRQHLQVSKQHVSESQFSFSCGECGKKFVNKTRLRDHVDWEHLNNIKFRCQLCNKAFKCHTSLYVHLKNVHRERGHKDNLCHVCGKSYQNAAKLRYHIVAMHTTATPYSCAHCGAAFGWYSSLYRHVREVHYKMKLHGSKAKKGKKRPPTPQTNTHTHIHAQPPPPPPPPPPAQTHTHSHSHRETHALAHT